MRVATVIIMLSLAILLIACSQNNNLESEQNTFISQNTLSGGAECSRGVENDSFPGSCSLYIDQNNNGLCDLGE